MRNKTSQCKHRVGIIADDLTGAADSGIQFAKKGCGTKLLFDIPKESNLAFYDVTVINTNSRDLSINDAYNKAYQVAALLKRNDINHLFKKIDSLLRGNWEAEVHAIADIYQPDFVVIAPAYPVMGRTTVKGSQLINGKAIHESEVANDTKFPVDTSNILDMVQQQLSSEADIQNISTHELRKDHHLWKSKLQNMKQQAGVKYLVFDIQYDSDLQQVVNHFTDLQGFKMLWVGTAGIAQYLPKMLTSSKNYVSPPSDNNGPVLVVAGSKTTVTRNQIKELTVELNVPTVELNPLMIFEDRNGNIHSDLVEQTYQFLIQNKHVVLCIKHLSSQQQAHLYELGQFYGYTNIEVGNKIVEQLGEITKGVMEKIPVENLVLTGGDTAIAVCKILGVFNMNLFREIEPGIPLGQLIGDRNINVVTKSGGFGDNKSLVNILNTLKGDVK